MSPNAPPPSPPPNMSNTSGNAGASNTPPPNGGASNTAPSNPHAIALELMAMHYEQGTLQQPVRDRIDTQFKATIAAINGILQNSTNTERNDVFTKLHNKGLNVDTTDMRGSRLKETPLFLGTGKGSEGLRMLRQVRDTIDGISAGTRSAIDTEIGKIVAIQNPPSNQSQPANTQTQTTQTPPVTPQPQQTPTPSATATIPWYQFWNSPKWLKKFNAFLAGSEKWIDWGLSKMDPRNIGRNSPKK